MRPSGLYPAPADLASLLRRRPARSGEAASAAQLGASTGTKLTFATLHRRGA
jgi:hypothetical protein